MELGVGLPEAVEDVGGEGEGGSGFGGLGLVDLGFELF